ncbi:MAG: VOC family protein [Amphiplicatus sp.]
MWAPAANAQGAPAAKAPEPRSSTDAGMYLTALAVADLDRSLEFYTEVLGLRFDRRMEKPERSTVLLRSADPSAADAALALTWLKGGQAPAPAGDAFFRLTIRGDADAAIARAKAGGYTVDREPYVSTVTGSKLGFIKDPDGYSIEIIGPKEGYSDPSQIRGTKLNVTDLERSLEFYATTMGLKEIRRHTFADLPNLAGVVLRPDEKRPVLDGGPAFIEVILGSDAEGQGQSLILTWRKMREGPYEIGGFAAIGLRTPDAAGLARRIKDAGFKVVREPAAGSTGGVVTALAADPDGYTVEIIEIAR